MFSSESLEKAGELLLEAKNAKEILAKTGIPVRGVEKGGEDGEDDEVGEEMKNWKEKLLEGNKEKDGPKDKKVIEEEKLKSSKLRES